LLQTLPSFKEESFQCKQKTGGARMIKHIITTDCSRSCSYCISKKINIKQADYKQLIELPALYDKLSQQHDSIMITGGEPTQANLFDYYYYLARACFKKVFITTQEETLLQWKKSSLYFDAITFSWHDLKAWRYAVTNDAVVYASILSHLYSDWLVRTVHSLGYSGLTINENLFTKDVFDESQLPQIEGFSIKINRRGQCFNNGTVYIMPDLSIRENFEEFL
jgi:molybdenum cofactor biosynthesis enzyme MoaA